MIERNTMKCKQIANVKHNGEEYDLVLFGEERHTSSNSDKTITTYPSWSVLTVIRKDEELFRSIFKKERIKNILLALPVVVLLAFAIFPTLFLYNSLEKNELLLPATIFGLLPLLVSLPFIIILIERSTGSFGQKYLRHFKMNSNNVQSFAQYSLINDKKVDEYYFSGALAKVKSFVDELSQEELVEFVVKSYEYGDLRGDLQTIEDTLSNGRSIKAFLKRDAEKTANEIRDEIEVIEQLSLRYENKYDNHITHRQGKSASKSTKKNKTSEEKLLEVLAKKKAA